MGIGKYMTNNYIDVFKDYDLFFLQYYYVINVLFLFSYIIFTIKFFYYVK